MEATEVTAPVGRNTRQKGQVTQDQQEQLDEKQIIHRTRSQTSKLTASLHASSEAIETETHSKEQVELVRVYIHFPWHITNYLTGKRCEHEAE